MSTNKKWTESHEEGQKCAGIVYIKMIAYAMGGGC